MQGDKKQGAGSKGTWGKIGDEYVKVIPHDESDEEDPEGKIQDAFAQDVKKKLTAEKLTADELEPLSITEDKSKYMKIKETKQLKKPEFELYVKNKENMYKESRGKIEFAYHDSNIIQTFIRN